MASETQQQGSCLCGKVSVFATPSSMHIDACHCDMCRQWGGGPLLAVECDGEVRFSGEEYISRYQSSEWAERAFCSQCGTHLFYRLTAGNHYALPVGLFGDGDWQFSKQIFIDQKPTYYAFANATEKLTGEEVFAAYAAK